MVKRKVSRPVGVSPISGGLCIGTVVGAAPQNIFYAMANYTELDQQINQVGAAAGELMSVLSTTKKAKAAMLKAGYPASFPVVQDYTELIPLETGVITAYETRNLNSIPSIWLRLTTAGNQLVADSDAAYSSGRDYCKHG